MVVYIYLINIPKYIWGTLQLLTLALHIIPSQQVFTQQSETFSKTYPHLKTFSKTFIIITQQALLLLFSLSAASHSSKMTNECKQRSI